MPIRVLIVDDNHAVRRGISGVLPIGELQVCGEAENGMEALQKAPELLPDLVLLDISMPGWDGLETCRRLRETSSQIKILILSQHDPAHLLPRALDAGADGCIDKSRLGTDLLPAIRNLFS